MNFCFDSLLAKDYKSNSQKIRIMSESWVGKNIYCPICGNPHITSLRNNMPVADFECNYCNEIFELKSKNGKISKKIADGAYYTMIDRITSNNNPNLFIMQYSSNWQVENLIFIPKFFLVPEIIEKRNPLKSTARRAGWIGCNILIQNIPEQGKIKIIENQIIYNTEDILNSYNFIKNIKTNNITSRSWLFDVLNCINNISSTDFNLQDVYKFSEELQKKHANNHNVEAKIRQQLQILRDKGFIKFLGNGHYKKLI